MLKEIRSHLSLKFLLSYLAVIVVCIGILIVGLKYTAPNSFARRIDDMPPGMREMMDDRRQGGMVRPLLLTGMQAAMGDALLTAGILASLLAIGASIFMSQQLVKPIREMKQVSHRIAEGHYEERVRVSGDPAKGEADELGDLALSFNRMAESLEHIEAMRRQLIGDVAHELRTPLTTIKGSMEALIDGVIPAEAETYQKIYQEADRLERMVTDLQELSRVEAGQYSLNLKQVSPSKLVEDVISRLGMQFKEKGVKLVSNISKGLPLVIADEDRIGQVMLNLVGNTLQYTPQKGKVTISATLVDKEIHFTIADTGIGIPLEHIPHLFDRFYRVDRSRSRARGGSGIGLTIARYLVEAHGGRIWVESAGIDKGSTFSFTIPVAKQ